MDLTVDADFGACARHGASVDGARVFGSTTQGEWLQRMGIVARLGGALALEDITERQVDQLITAPHGWSIRRRWASGTASWRLLMRVRAFPAGFAAEGPRGVFFLGGSGRLLPVDGV